jgi:hypothetical protein
MGGNSTVKLLCRQSQCIKSYVNAMTSAGDLLIHDSRLAHVKARYSEGPHCVREAASPNPDRSDSARLSGILGFFGRERRVH